MKPAIGEAVPESFFSAATPAVGEEVPESFFESSKPAIGEAVPDSFFESSVPSAQIDAGQRDNAVSKEATVPPTGLLHTAKSFLARPIPGERAVAQAAQNTIDWLRGVAPDHDTFGTLETPSHEQSIPAAALQAFNRGIIARPVHMAMDNREAYATNPDSSFIGRNVAEAAIQGEGRAFSVIERLGGYQAPDGELWADRRNTDLQGREQRAAALDAETGSSQFWGQAIRGAGASLMTSAGGAIVGGPAGAIGAAVSTTGNMAVTEGIDAGLEGEELRNYVTRQMAAEGIPSAAFQMVGLGGLEKILGGLQLRRLGKEGAQSAKRGVVEALKGLGWNVAEEIPEELIVETLQTLNDHYSGVQDVRELTPEQIRHHVMQTVAQTVLAVGAASTPNIAKGTGESLVDARQRRRDTQASTATPVEPAVQAVLAEPQRPPAEPAEDPASAPPEPSEDVETVSPTQVPTETEIVQQRPAEAVEEDADQGRGEDTGESLLPPSSHPVMELPVAILQLSEDVPNFKEGSDESGVVEGQQLDGTFERLGTAPIVVWERSNGRLEVITGRHRLDLARRSGENSIPAQVVREQDGFSQQHALTFDAESNIRDGQGSVRDYAHYFRNAEISEEEAGQRGLLSRAKGQDGWYLGHHATNDLYDAFRNRSIAERGAVAIVRAAPGNEAGQRVGLRYSQANPKASAQEIGNAVRSAVAMAGHVEGTQTDLFGNVTDDAFLAEMERRGKIASDQQRLVAEQIRILNAAKIDPAKARELGIDIKIGDRAGIEAERTRLRQLQERWREWHLDPELRAIVMEEEGARGVQETLPEQTGEQRTETTGDLFGTSQEPAGQQLIDTSEQQLPGRNVEPEPPQVPTTSPRTLEVGPLTQYSNRPDGWVAGDGQPIASGQPVRLRGFRGTGRTESDNIYGPGIDAPIFGNATYLAHSKRDAEIYGPDVSESDVTLQNPLVLTNSNQISALMDNRPVPTNAADMVPFMQEFTKRVKRRGHDGVIVNLSDADVDHAGASNKHLQRLFGHSQAVVFPKARPSRSSGHADAASPQLTLPDIPRPAGDAARTVAESPRSRRPRNELLDPTVAERPDLVNEWRGRLFGPNRGPRVEVLDVSGLDITVEEALRYTDDPVLQAAAREAQERGDSVIVTPPGYDKQAEYDPATRTVRVTRNATGAEVAHEFLHGVLEHTGPLNRAEQQALKRGIRDRQGRNWNELDAAGRRGFTEEVIRQGIAYFEQHSAAPQSKMERALWKIGQWVKSILDGLGLRNLTPEDVFDRLYRGYGQGRRGDIWGPGRSPFEGGDGRQASVRAGLTAREELGRQVAMDAYAGGKLRTESPVIFSYAPSWMRMLGHGDHQTIISQRGMQKITTDKHWLNKRVIEKLPAAIADPLEVLLHDERYVVITDLDGERGTKVAVIIEPDAFNQNQPFHIIKSVYPAGEGQIAAWRRHKDYRIVYRKEETPTVTGGVQFAKVAAKGSLEDSSIATSRDLDKWEAENLSAEERQTVRTGARLNFDQATGEVREEPDTRASIRRNPQTETPEFRRWFGNSKVVDAEGNPLVVYHGTSSKIHEFRKRALGSNTKASSAQMGFFFTNTPRNAAEYAGGEVTRRDVINHEDIVASWPDEDIAAYRAAEEYRDSLRPKGTRYDDWRYSDEYRKRNMAVSKLYEELSKKNDAGFNILPVFLSLQKPLIHDMQGKHYRDVSFTELIREAKRKRRDGVIIQNTYDPLLGDVYVAFRSEQIKSATGNIGAFDPANPDIRASIRRPGEDGAGRSRDENPKQQLDLYPPSGEPTPGDRTQAAVVQLPELVRLARGLMDGRYPRVMKRIRVMGGNALGVFRGEPGNPRMELRADIFVGPLLATQRSRRRLSDEAIEEFRQKVLSELDIPEDKLVIRQERQQGFNVVNVYLEDSSYASRTLAHEIGHLVDFLPDHDLGRGNVLGRIATLKRHLRQSISGKPDGEKALSPKDRRELRRRARAKASQELGKFATKDEIAEATKEFYYDYLIEELERRDLIVENTITSPSGAEFPGVRDELKNLTHWWKPFEAIPGDSYTDYRYSSVELYADALSVMLNHPVAFREKAPIFSAAFDAYLKRKPQVKQLYEEIQQEIHGARETETRLNDIYAMFDRGDEERRRIREKKKKSWSLRGFLKELERFFIESRAHIPKTSDPDMDPRVWTSELMYLSSTATQFFRDVNARILQELEQHSLDQKHLAAFLFLRRAETERRLMANPLGLQGEFASETMQAMQQELGAERFAVLEGLANQYRELREDYVFPLLRETRLLSEDLLEHIENNENYATFNVIEYLDKAFGGPGSGAAIYKQLGTLQEIESPFVAMMMKDISLIRAAVRNQAKRATVSKLSELGETEPATRRWDGKKLAFVEPQNPDQSLMVYSEDGQLRGAYIDKAVAEWFDADPVRAGLVGRALDTLNRPYRAAWITYAPWFGFWNFQRDWRAMWMHLPENPVTLTPKLLWNTVVATRHAFLDAFFDHSTPLVRDMYRMNVLVPDMNYRAQEWEGHDTELERILSTYDVFPGQRERLSKKVALAIPRLIRNWNATLERITKVAGYRYLLRNGYFEREGMQARERVRSMIGTPNALTGGTARIWLNRIFLFSNINIQGWRAASMAIRERPGTYLLKMAMADVLPKVAMFAAASGLLRVIRDMSGGSGGDGDDEEDELKAIMDRIPEWDKESYTVIPLGLTEDDQAVYMLFPHDHVGQFAGSMIWVALQQLEGAVPSEFGRIVERHVPIGPGNLNPGLRLTMDVANYMYGRNPHDEFWGGEKISTDAFTAGGMTGLRELLQNEWDASFGGFYRFKARNQVEAENELEAVLNLPGIGNVFRRFVRVSRRGLDDQLQRDISLAEKDVAAQVIQMKDIIRESLSQEERGRKAPTPALMREAWQRAREAGAVPEGYERQYFDMRYKRAWIWRYGTDEERLSLQTTSSVRERLNRP